MDESQKAERFETIGYVLEIPDHELNDYCFTDGIGKISLGLAALITWKMKINLTSLVRKNIDTFRCNLLF